MMKSKLSYQMCIRCIMDTSDWEINFDESGLCNHCKKAFELMHLNQKRIALNGKLLEETIDKVKKATPAGSFHGIVGLSGGVDSSYLLHLLSQFDMRILAVHVDAGWNSIEAVRNIHNMISKLNIALETIVIDWHSMRNLQHAYLKSGLINQDVPQDHAIFSSIFQVSQSYKAKYVFSGSNLATESILPESWGQDALDGLQIKDVFKKHGNGSLSNFPVTRLSDFLMHSVVIHDYVNITPLNLIKYSKSQAKEILVAKYAWQDYGGKHLESRFTEYFQEVYLPRRFGISKKRAHLSSQIVSGDLERSEALEIIDTPQYDHLGSLNLERFIADKLEISMEELNQYSIMPYVSESQYRNERARKSKMLYIGRMRQRAGRLFGHR